MTGISTRKFAAAAQLAKDQHGWSVRDLAARSGVPVATVHLAVTTGNIMLSSALRIAAALGLRAGDLGDTDEK
jgi:DNA-directed RNA polymerase specialized sigma24 family protein